LFFNSENKHGKGILSVIGLILGLVPNIQGAVHELSKTPLSSLLIPQRMLTHPGAEVVSIIVLEFIVHDPFFFK
jgi:hypothetical protein